MEASFFCQGFFAKYPTDGSLLLLLRVWRLCLRERAVRAI